jgi:hypothetical protein
VGEDPAGGEQAALDHLATGENKMTAASLWFGLLAPATATAGSADPNYPATNALTTQVLRPWLATGTASDFLQIDLGASKTIVGVVLNAANMASVTVFADNANPPTTNRGTLTLQQDGQGRYKASMSIAATVRYVRFAIAAGSTVDGSGAWGIGFAGVYSGAFSPAKDPLFGESSQDQVTPQSRDDLDNGVVIRDNTGPSYMLITRGFSGGSADDHEQIQQYARASVCWWNDGNPSAAWNQWPVRYHEPKVTRRISGFNREQVSILLKEEV